MNFIVIRHTRIHNPNNLCYGRTDISLSDSFLLDWEETKNRLMILINQPEYFSKKISNIYSSPSERCTLLAEKISSILKTEPTIKTDKRLYEYNFGDWEGVPWDKISEEESSKWMNDYVNTAPPNGENMIEFAERVENFILEKKMSQTSDDEASIIVTHGGWIRLALAKKLNISLSKIFEIQVDYGSIHTIDF